MCTVKAADLPGDQEYESGLSVDSLSPHYYPWKRASTRVSELLSDFGTLLPGNSGKDVYLTK